TVHQGVAYRVCSVRGGGFLAFLDHRKVRIRACLPGLGRSHRDRPTSETHLTVGATESPDSVSVDGAREMRQPHYRLACEPRLIRLQVPISLENSTDRWLPLPTS